MTPGFRPRGDDLLVRLSPPAATSAGGIALPQNLDRRETEGTVLAAGPGVLLPDGKRPAITWFIEADVVVFAQHDFRLLEGREGLVSARAVVATVAFDGSLHPENDYVMLSPDRAPSESAGGIALPETARKTARAGRLLATGPGPLVTTGPLAGLCKPVWAALNVPREWVTAAPKVWYSADSMARHAGGKVFVHAKDLLFWEE